LPGPLGFFQRPQRQNPFGQLHHPGCHTRFNRCGRVGGRSGKSHQYLGSGAPKPFLSELEDVETILHGQTAAFYIPAGRTRWPEQFQVCIHHLVQQFVSRRIMQFKILICPDLNVRAKQD
jgi:hypothetical protein